MSAVLIGQDGAVRHASCGAGPDRWRGSGGVTCADDGADLRFVEIRDREQPGRLTVQRRATPSSYPPLWPPSPAPTARAGSGRWRCF